MTKQEQEDTPAWIDGVSEEELARALRAKFAPVLVPHGSPPVPVRLLRSLCLLTLVPLRLLLCAIIMSSAAVWCLLCTLGFKAWDEAAADTVPLPSWRRRLIAPVVAGAGRLSLFVLGFFWIRVRGKDNLPASSWSTRLTVVSNHISLMDCLYLTYAFCPAFVVKADVATWPLFGYIASTLQAIYVDRPNAKTKFGSAVQRLLQRQKRADRGNIVCFPEGTTLNDRYLIDFRTGAFVHGEPVLPVVLRYPFRWVSPMFGPESAIQTLVKIAATPCSWMVVEYLPLYSPSPAEQTDPKLFATNVRQRMATIMKDPPVKLSDVSNTDLLKYWSGYVVRKEPAHRFLSAEEFETYRNLDPHLLVPTAQARRLAKKALKSVAPSPETP